MEGKEHHSTPFPVFTRTLSLSYVAAIRAVKACDTRPPAVYMSFDTSHTEIARPALSILKNGSHRLRVSFMPAPNLVGISCRGKVQQCV